MGDAALEEDSRANVTLTDVVLEHTDTGELVSLPWLSAQDVRIDPAWF